MDIEERQSSEQVDDEQQPFLVLYNYRLHRTHPPKPRLPRVRQPKPHSTSIILTRKMAAELSLKTVQIKDALTEETNVPIAYPHEEEKNFFNAGELQRGIPMQDKDDGDILYNMNSLSYTQNYSKLQKVLFGLPLCDVDSGEGSEKVNF